VPFDATLTAFGGPYIAAISGGGPGIWIHDNVLYGTNGGDLITADVSDPLKIVELGRIEGIGARAVGVTVYDNRALAILAGSGLGMHIIDETDPTKLMLRSTIDMPSAGVHNVSTVSGTPYVYSSGASGQAKRIDVADPYTPKVPFFPIPVSLGGLPVQPDGCRDITVRYDLGRAYYAGGGT
jgi:hypothetical protein